MTSEARFPRFHYDKNRRAIKALRFLRVKKGFLTLAMKI